MTVSLPAQSGMPHPVPRDRGAGAGNHGRRWPDRSDMTMFGTGGPLQHDDLAHIAIPAGPQDHVLEVAGGRVEPVGQEEKTPTRLLGGAEFGEFHADAVVLHDWTVEVEVEAGAGNGSTPLDQRRVGNRGCAACRVEVVAEG